MMQCKIVACILLILSVFSFAVLTAPVPVRRGAHADAVEGRENAIIASGKRAPIQGGPALPGGPFKESDFSDSEFYTITPDKSSPPATPNSASSGRPSVSFSTSSSDGGKSPVHSGESPMWSKVWSTPDGTKVDWDPVKNQPEKPTKIQWGTTTVHEYKPLAEPLYPIPPGRVEYINKVAAQRLEASKPPKPPKKSFTGHLKSFFGKLGKLKFRPRFQRTVDARA